MESETSIDLAALGKEVKKFASRTDQAEQFGKYQIKKELGRGGMGAVYHAYDTELKRDVALKVILANESPAAAQRFTQEASAMAALEHPNIIKIYEVGQTPKPFFTMELIDGVDFSKLIQRGHVKSTQVAEILGKIAEALYFMHRKKIIHRDIKPANIMITSKGEPKLMDFGLVKSSDGAQLSKTGEILGTPAYMPPEQVEGKAIPASDIYSLGAALYQAITKRPPFQGETEYNVIMRVMESEVIAPSELNSDVSPYLEAICLKCLSKKVNKRYKNAKLLAKDLQNFARNRPVSAKPYSTIDQMKSFVGKYKQVCLFAGLVTMFLTAFGITMFFLYQDKEKLAQDQRKLVKEREQTIQEKNNLAQKQKAMFKEQQELLDMCLNTLRHAFRRNPSLKQDQDFLNAMADIYDQADQQNLKLKQDDYIIRSFVFTVSTKKKDSKKALETFNDMVTQYESAGAYCNRANYYYTNNNFDSAIQDASTAIGKKPDFAIAYFTRARAYAGKGLKQKALQDYRQAVQLDPSDPNFSQAYFVLGSFEKGRKNWLQAEDYYTKSIKMDPKREETYQQRGLVYRNLGKPFAAINDFSQAIQLSKTTLYPAYGARGATYYEQKNYKKAKADFEVVVKGNASRSLKKIATEGLREIRRIYQQKNK